MPQVVDRQWGLTYAAITLLVIAVISVVVVVVVVPPPASVVALPVVVVPGMHVSAAEVVRMNEKKSKKRWGDSLSSLSLPYPSLWSQAWTSLLLRW